MRGFPATGILLALLLLAQSSWLVAFSTKEGVGVMTWIALAVALAPVAVLAGWYFLVRRLNGSVPILLAGGAVLLVIMEAVLPASPVKTSLSNALQKRSLAAVEVLDAEDELFLSPRGNPVGVRVTFKARFPRGGDLSVSPTIYAESEHLRQWQTAMSHFAGFRVTPEPVKGGSGRWSFRKGQVYRFTADFLPAFLFLASRGERGLAPGDLCFSLEGMGAPLPEGEGGLPVSAPGSRYRLEVVGRGNTYFISPRVLYSRETTETYTPKTFYESALAEGAGPCPWI